MTTPTLTELPRTLEPTTADPFIASTPSRLLLCPWTNAPSQSGPPSSGPPAHPYGPVAPLQYTSTQVMP
jgi:hypothetical protein